MRITSLIVQLLDVILGFSPFVEECTKSVPQSFAIRCAVEVRLILFPNQCDIAKNWRINSSNSHREVLNV